VVEFLQAGMRNPQPGQIVSCSSVIVCLDTQVLTKRFTMRCLRQPLLHLTFPRWLAMTCEARICLKNPTSLWDAVSTTRGSGWVADETCDIAKVFELV
jgi:hypothetical protein